MFVYFLDSMSVKSIIVSLPIESLGGVLEKLKTVIEKVRTERIEGSKGTLPVETSRCLEKRSRKRLGSTSSHPHKKRRSYSKHQEKRTSDTYDSSKVSSPPAADLPTKRVTTSSLRDNTIHQGYVQTKED